MKKYEVKIILDNEDEVQVRVEAKDQEDALRRIQENDVFLKFVGEKVVKKIHIKPIEMLNPSNDRFLLQPSEEKENEYVLTDRHSLCAVKFDRGKFNETMKIKAEESRAHKIDALDMATAMREMADYLIENHKEIL
jgi:hypothetical protein